MFREHGAGRAPGKEACRQKYIRKTFSPLTAEGINGIFLSNTETLEAKVKPEGAPTESGGS